MPGGPERSVALDSGAAQQRGQECRCRIGGQCQAGVRKGMWNGPISSSFYVIFTIIIYFHIVSHFVHIFSHIFTIIMLYNVLNQRFHGHLDWTVMFFVFFCAGRGAKQLERRSQDRCPLAVNVWHLGRIAVETVETLRNKRNFSNQQLLSFLSLLEVPT